MLQLTPVLVQYHQQQQQQCWRLLLWQRCWRQQACQHAVLCCGL
jgi:hypothetical protein